VKRNLLPLFGIALAAAVAATGVFYALLPAGISGAKAEAHAAVVVAARDVALGSTVRPEDLRAEPWKLGPLPDGAARLVSDVAGKVALRPIAAGEVVRAGSLGPAGTGALAAIPPGYRALSLHPVDSAGVVSMLQPGSRVDVLVVNVRGEAYARRVLEDVSVLQVQKAEAQRPVVTVLALPEQADRLALADAMQQIRLLARNPAEKARAADE
jgi:pilus assembly protein CpaB